MTGKIVVTFEPVWAQADVIKAIYGVPKPTLLRLAGDGKIRSRRMADAGEIVDQRTTRVYRCADVAEWLDKEALDPAAGKTEQVVA
jgi:hypothetical protein